MKLCPSIKIVTVRIGKNCALSEEKRTTKRARDQGQLLQYREYLESLVLQQDVLDGNSLDIHDDLAAAFLGNALNQVFGPSANGL